MSKLWYLILFRVLLAVGVAMPPLVGLAGEQFGVAADPATFEFAFGSAYVGTNYLVAFVSGTNLAIQRISTNGQLFGSPSLFSTNVGMPPAVAFVGGHSNALLVWSDMSLTNGVTAFGRICQSDGTLGSVFPLLDSAGPHGFQHVVAAAFDGDRYLVLWVDEDQSYGPGEQYPVYGQFVTVAGIRDGSEFLVFSGADIEPGIGFCWGQTNYLMAWQQRCGTDKWETVCRSILPSGATGVIEKISYTVSQDHNPVVVDFDGTNFFVLWNCTTNYHGAGELMLAGRLVSPSSVPLGVEHLWDPGKASFMAMAFDGSHHLVLWGSESTTANATVCGKLLDRSLTPIGPVFWPFSWAGGWPPLLPWHGALFDGQQFLLTATFGTFVVNEQGEIQGMNGGDVYARVLRSSAEPPVFRSLGAVSSNLISEITVVPGVCHTLEISTNLSVWQPVGWIWSTNSETFTLMANEDELAESDRLFLRLVLGNTMGVFVDISFLEYASGGGFGEGLTPTPSYPVTLNSYRVLLGIVGEFYYPPAETVAFTGPVGSGLTNVPAESVFMGEMWAQYASPPVGDPPAAPGGEWTFVYNGTNIVRTVPDPEAAVRLVLPLPTVATNGEDVVSVGWVYMDPDSGLPLGAPPQFMTSIQGQIDGLSGERLYNSPLLSPAVTEHTLPPGIRWANVSAIMMAYGDTLENSYVVVFTRP